MSEEEVLEYEEPVCDAEDFRNQLRHELSVFWAGLAGGCGRVLFRAVDTVSAHVRPDGLDAVLWRLAG